MGKQNRAPRHKARRPPQPSSAPSRSAALRVQLPEAASPVGRAGRGRRAFQRCASGAGMHLRPREVSRGGALAKAQGARLNPVSGGEARLISQPTLRRTWPRGIPKAAMCVQVVDDRSVLQFTLLHAVGCALHRRKSRVIHRIELYSGFEGPRRGNIPLASTRPSPPLGSSGSDESKRRGTDNGLHDA